MENTIKNNNLMEELIEQKITVNEYLSALFDQLELDSN
ncbi:hypothetical protein BX659_10249 [Orenia metallireducens]|jgi:hypothetical protein|uniref:Uncharacterized protein n=1 Tax=Orenia metallireducens TaxID=1413210 RepID=A0A285F289_9FIRM|nr:hypothetical protein BX659_10249 [Orenia metallireducens]SNY05405.1 hypothetical protein SAMN06265827_10149 [Orenia metallireducens]